MPVAATTKPPTKKVQKAIDAEAKMRTAATIKHNLDVIAGQPLPKAKAEKHEMLAVEAGINLREAQNLYMRAVEKLSTKQRQEFLALRAAT